MSWEGSEGFWGLVSEGNDSDLGTAKFDGSFNSQLTPPMQTEEISNHRLIADSCNARLWVDDAIEQAFVQKGSEQPLVIYRNGNYWDGDVPFLREEAELVGAAVDAMGRIRVLNRGPWGDFNWILDNRGRYAGEQGPGDTANENHELLFQLDLNQDRLIGTFKRRLQSFRRALRRSCMPITSLRITAPMRTPALAHCWKPATHKRTIFPLHEHPARERSRSDAVSAACLLHEPATEGRGFLRR